jgi:hypothetical protein
MADTCLVDPLGRELVLHDRTWLRHIVKGHPEIAGDRSFVEEAVLDPDEIRMSLSDTDCRIYYGRGPRVGVKMMVVADVVVGIVKTAHLARRIAGGDVEWSR